MLLIIIFSTVFDSLRLFQPINRSVYDAVNLILSESTCCGWSFLYQNIVRHF